MEAWQRKVEAGERTNPETRPRYADAPQRAVTGGYEYCVDDWAYATPPGRSHMWCRDDTFIYDASRKVHVVKGWWHKGESPRESIASWALQAVTNVDRRLVESPTRSYGANNVPDGAQWQARFRVEGFRSAFRWLAAARKGS